MLRSVLKELSSSAAGAEMVSGSCFGNMRVEEDWEKLTVAEAFARFAPIDPVEALQSDDFDRVLVEYIEPNLGVGRPTFLHDYPAQCASLARLKEDDERVAERFELYVDGVELANGFSELTDAAEQRRRLAGELSRMEPGHGMTAMPERFLEDLAELDTAAGVAFGVDRLLMLLMSADSIAEVVSLAPGDLS
jgi:lysyl-tRNA synthetase class 2